MEEITPRGGQRYSICLGSSVEEVSSPWRMKTRIPNENRMKTRPNEKKSEWKPNENKTKAAIKLYYNADPTMAAVRSFEELAVQNWRQSIIKDAKMYAEELDLQLWLNFHNPVAVADGKEVETKKVKQAICKSRQPEIQSTVSEERWQRKLIKNKWDDEKVKLEECFAWLSSWKNAPTHTIAGVQELHQQLLPTKVYYNRKTKSTNHWWKMLPMRGFPGECAAHSIWL